ncbi:protein-L-isoaspartate O-methyltransferase [Janibacter terrae]|uniref:Protein-L-isoaspartate O-methyltransferase n=1 Tax=Janibacter terrae TaxID=103817 RepID=A0ABZ2FGA3_9MICO
MQRPDRVEAAMRACPRERFLPPARRASAHLDAPVAIGHQQTNSQPRTVLAMLRLLDVRPGLSVLDVGSGSGWTAAILGELVGPSGSVLGVERIPQLVAAARDALALDPRAWVRVEQAETGVLGAPDRAPFDRVLVSAEPAALPDALVEQLRPGGVMVIPVAGEMLRVVRGSGGTTVTRHGRYRFVPLVED